MNAESDSGAPGPSWLTEIAAQPVDREALLFEGEVATFGEMARSVEGLVDAFDRGALSGILQRGERIALFAPPSAAGVVLIHACLERGVVMVPWNLRWTEAECVFAAQESGANWIVVSGETEVAGNRIAESVGCGLLRLVEMPRLGAKLERLRAPRSSGAKRSVTEQDPDRADIIAQDGALLLFTSGTSGRPKAALLSKHNLRASARASIELLGRESDDRWLCCMPLFHIGGLSILIRSVLAGTSVVLQRSFDATEVARALDRDRITCVSWVAAMLARVLDVRGNLPAPSALRLVLLGGGPAPDSLLERAERLGYPMALTYGLTEAASQVATRPPGRVRAAGASRTGGLEPLPGTELRIVDDEGLALGPDIVGGIEVRSATVMCGYFRDPEATRATLRDGWLATGDVGLLDRQGGLRVLDRRSDLIVSGGENIYPAEVESVLVSCPGVVEAAVFGAPDPEFGAQPRAVVVVEADSEIDVQTILSFCRARLAGYKVPRSVDFVDALPRTASGKVLRRELAERLR